MANIGKLSHLTGRMIPRYVQESHPQFVTFITAFFEYLERENGEYDLIANLVNTANVDEVIDDYILFYRKTYAQGFPEIMQADFRFLVKQLKTFYSAKGTEKSIEFLFRTIFNAQVKFYYPKVDMLRVSDGKWFQPQYLIPGRHEINGTPGIAYVDHLGNNISKIDIFSLVDHKIRGKTSGATAYVDERKELRLAYPDKIDNYTFLTDDLEWTPVDTATAIIDNRVMTIDRVSNIGDVAITKTFTDLEENKTYQLIIQFDGSSPGTGVRININGVEHDYTFDDIKDIERFDISFVPEQGGDDIITISPIDTGTSGTLRITQTRLTVQGITYPFYGLSLSDVEGVFLPDEEIEVTNLDYDDFRIVRPFYDIENGIIIPNGAYVSEDGFLSYKKFLQDSFYYQEFSYELRSDIQPKLYLDTIKELVHPAGFKLFGKLDVDTLRFIDLNDLAIYTNFLIRWTRQQAKYLNDERELFNHFKYNMKATYIRAPESEDYNSFVLRKEEPNWYDAEHRMLDRYTFYELEAMESENQVMVFIDGLKIPNKDYTILDNQISFNNIPAVTNTNNIEIFRLLGVQYQVPTNEILINGQTDIEYYDVNMKDTHSTRFFVFRNGKLLSETDEYTRTITGITLTNIGIQGDIVEIITIYHTVNHDVYEDALHVPSHTHAVSGTITSSTSNPIIDSGQMIQEKRDLSNILVFLDGVKLHTKFLNIQDDLQIRLQISPIVDTNYHISSFFVDVIKDKVMYTGDGSKNVFPLPTSTEFEYRSPIVLRKSNVSKLITNSEFDTDLSGWVYNINDFVWSNGSMMSINPSRATVHNFNHNISGLTNGDTVKIELLVRALEDDITIGLSSVGINIDDHLNTEFNKTVNIDNGESIMLETVQIVNGDETNIEFTTTGLMSIEYIRVWKELP